MYMSDVQGGDYTLIQNTDQWITSTTQDANWRVIEVTEATPVVDMLPTAVRDQVKQLMIPLFGKSVTPSFLLSCVALTSLHRWVSTMLDPDVPPTSKQPVWLPLQPMPSGWFFLGWSSDSSQALLVKPTLPGKQGRNAAVVPAKNSSSMYLVNTLQRRRM